MIIKWDLTKLFKKINILMISVNIAIDKDLYERILEGSYSYE